MTFNKIGTKYEIKCNETWAFYEGYVVDYNNNTKLFHVMYPDDWKPAGFVPLDDIRPLPTSVDNWKPQPNEQIECKAKAAELEPYGWWGCRIKKMKTNSTYSISYDGWNDHYEVLQLNMIRPYNDRKLECEYENIPKIIMQKYKLAIALDDIKIKTKLIHLGYHIDQDKLVFIGTKQQIKDAKFLVKFRQLDFHAKLKLILQTKSNTLVSGYCKQQQRIFDDLFKNHSYYDIAADIKNICLVYYHIWAIPIPQAKKL